LKVRVKTFFFLFFLNTFIKTIKSAGGAVASRRKSSALKNGELKNRYSLHVADPLGCLTFEAEVLVNLTLQIKQPGEFQSNLKDLCHGLNNEAPQGTYFSCIY